MCAGFTTPNGSMYSTPAHYDAPALDESNAAVIWKAIDVSMVDSPLHNRNGLDKAVDKESLGMTHQCPKVLYGVHGGAIKSV